MEVVCPSCSTRFHRPSPPAATETADPARPESCAISPAREQGHADAPASTAASAEPSGQADCDGPDVHDAPTVSLESDGDSGGPEEDEENTGASPPDRRADEDDIEILRDFGDYEILSEVGRGAMGIVYRARQKHLQREVAIKVLLAGAHASRKQVARFYKEAQAAAKLRHPNIVPIHEIGRCQGRHFYTMDFIHGKSLGKLIAEGVVSIRRSLELCIELADALAYAHAHKVIHRDIKPSNILVDLDGRPHIMDFGLAKQLDSGTKFTQTGSAIGTPAYMSPEQAAGESHRLDQRSDVYSLGAVLYELVTSRPPFEGENMMNIIMQVLNHDPPLPRGLNPKVHRDIQTIILKAMEKNPERRYQGMGELGDDLRRFLAGEAIQARPSSLLYRAWRRTRKHTLPIVSALMALAIATASAIAVLFLNQKLREKDQELSRLGEEVQRVIEKEAEKTRPQEVTEVADEFDGPVLKEVWKPLGNGQAWSLIEGELAASAKGEAVLMLDPPLPLKGNMKFEFDVRFLGVVGPRLDTLIGIDQNQAYRLILEGGESGPHLLLQRSGVNLAQVDVTSLAPGSAYHCLLEREDYRLRFDVRTADGPVASLHYNDFDIIRDLGIFRLGFAVWDTSARYDSVRLTREGIPPQAPLFYFPQKQLILSQDYDVAIEKLTQIMADYMGKFEALQASHLIGRCWELKGQPQKALDFYLQIPQAAPAQSDPEIEKLLTENELRKFFCYVPLNRLSEAARSLAFLSDRGIPIEAAWIWHFRDAVQRCLNTPRLEEALVIFQKVRFRAGADPAADISLHALSKALGQSLYHEFLIQAVQLATRFGQGAYPHFDHVMDLYLAFPDSQMTLAFEKSVVQAIQLGQLEAALRLLRFAREKALVSDGLKQAAVALGNEFCKLRQFQRVNEVYQSFPANNLVSAYRTAVDGLLAQGERAEACQLFEKAQGIFRSARSEDAPGLVEAELETMKANLAAAFAGTGAYPDLLKILAMPGPPSRRLLAPIELAITRAIDLEEHGPAIEILKVVRERSLPMTDTLVRETLRLGSNLARKRMVQTAQEVYNAFPIPEFARSFLELLDLSHRQAQEVLDRLPAAQELARSAQEAADAAQRELELHQKAIREALLDAQKSGIDPVQSPEIIGRREKEKTAQGKVLEEQKRLEEAQRNFMALQQDVQNHYSVCLGVLKFIKDKLDQGQMKDSEPQFIQFLLQFAGEANRRRRFPEVIAAHRAFPSDKLLPQFIAAAEAAHQSGDWDALVRLLPYARQHWPFPQAPELHARLLQVADQLAERAVQPEAAPGRAPAETSPAAALSPDRAVETFDILLDSFTAALAPVERTTAAQQGIALETADLFLFGRRPQEARKRLQALVQSLPRQHEVRGHAILRLAALVTDAGEKEAALQLWKNLAEEGSLKGPFLRLQAFMSGEVGPEIFDSSDDRPLWKFLFGQRSLLRGEPAGEIRALLAESVRLSRASPDWHTALASARLAALGPAPSPPAEGSPARDAGTAGAENSAGP
ncbi:MAG: protein kinase [Planctomycetes bacterium]|nr:protein kinase [Planctomycetota bacterium]